MTNPAIVHGNKSNAVAVFEEDSRGDLVDIHFFCLACVAATTYDAAQLWPAYDFSPDYDSSCTCCGKLIEKAAA